MSETSSLNLCTISSLNWDLRGERGWGESQDSLGGEKSSVFQYCNFLLIFLKTIPIQYVVVQMWKSRTEIRIRKFWSKVSGERDAPFHDFSYE